MLGFIFNKTAGLLGDTYDLVANATEYIVEDIASIPDEVSKGWNDGVFTPSSDTEDIPQDTVEIKKPTKFGAR